MTTDTSARATDTVRAGFDAVAAKDLSAFAAAFRPDATWNHRNDDRLGGIHDGVEAIVAFLRESIQLTQGTLSAVPQAFMPDEAGRVAVLARVSGTRPDGRTFDDTQVLMFTLDGDRIRSVDQFIGNPTAVSAFWA
jgi:ketosteroid isomerase-like protein